MLTTPEIITLFSSSIIFIYGLYASILYAIGGAREREEARHTLYRALIAGLLFAAVMLSTAFVGFGVRGFLEAVEAAADETGSKPLEPHCLKYFDLAPSFNIDVYFVAGAKALECSAKTFSEKFSRYVDAYSTIFSATTITGLAGVTSPLSMSLFQVAMPFSGAANGAMLSLATAYAASLLAIGLMALAGLAAILIAVERLELLGAVIAAFNMAMPPALAAYADYVREVEVTSFGYPVLYGAVLNAVVPAANIAAAAALAFTMAGAVTAAITYAMTKIPERISVE
ncbi:hypothetical protein [Pyrobaculum ferrireducens]|uniref:Uncharacterized protein n=1 Tax=Pyrobaculum ferrireducens TaxID=1104324 RepID=G7VF01_9CREN|nr:hypothetical protein [Pyrobaculum ferrireducens]AET34166.1 hypothetical protein P186_2790 [Pyrobaculum ferrireducens]